MPFLEMCLSNAEFSSFKCSLYFSFDSAPVSDTLVLSSRFGNMLLLKPLVELGMGLKLLVDINIKLSTNIYVVE